jgi:membrane-bound lytic murein transglycosylase D
MRLFWTLVFMAPSLAWAQLRNEVDTLAGSRQDAVVALADTLTPNFQQLPSDFEYIPADETPAQVADRLSELERTIPLTYNEKVHAFINYFLIRDREHTRNVLRKKELYFPMFEKQLAENNLPDELKYLAIIESALYPRAVSRARAVGLWQFMSGTGRYMGLKIDWYIDERMDPEKSTAAACKYLIQLHRIFNDWELALAAYNSGPGTVKRAIKRSGYKKNFWEIYPYLPRETRAYLPQFVAMIYAVNHAEEHNLYIEGYEEPMRQDTLNVSTYLHLQTLAALTGACLDDIQRINPSIQHNILPGDGRRRVLRLPLDAKIELDKNRSFILDSASRAWKKETEMLAKNAAGNTYGREMLTYHVKSGDAISVIAQRYRVRVEDIRQWNGLSSNTIRTGQKLKVWVLPSQMEGIKQQSASASGATARQTAAEIALPAGATTYTVQPGDTLWDISRKFEGLTVERLKTLNKLKTNKLQPGQKLIISQA